MEVRSVIFRSAVDQFGDERLGRLDPFDAAGRETVHSGSKQVDRAQHIGGDQRLEDVEFEMPLHPADGNRLMIADHLRRDHRQHFALRRVNLAGHDRTRSEEHTYELTSLMRISYAVFCLKKKKYSL